MPDLNALSTQDQLTTQQYLARLAQYNDQYANAQNQQNALGRYFGRVMAGTGPSVVQQQIQAGLDQQARQQQAQVAGTSGVNAAAARREAMQNTANAQVQASQTAAMARTQEQADAAKMAANIRAQQAAEAAGMFGANTSGAASFANTASGGTQKQADINQQEKQSERQLYGNLASAGGGALATVAASDKNEKKDIQGISDADMKAFMSHLGGKTFDYKHPDGETEMPGHRVGVIAQDVEQGGPVGKSVVVGGKPLGLDLHNAVGASMAAIGYLARKVQALEGRKE